MELKENERIDDLELNNLKIIQNKNGFCFGMDSVLLSDFAKNVKLNAKVIDFKIHDLRHCAVSWYFVNTNLTDIEISEISGHIELSTLKRYATLRHNDIGAKLWANEK